jgi:hypothetical protein
VANVLLLEGELIVDDLSCVHCGYNLRGLTRDHICPECGTSIARSIYGNQLRYCDPQWLETLRFGTALTLWNILITILLYMGAVIMASAGAPAAITTLVTLIAQGLGVWAAFLITTPEPRVALQENPITLRKVVRVCAVIGLSGQMLSQFGTLGSADLAIVLGAVGGVLSLAVVAQNFCELVYFRRFARRVPDARLEKSTSIVLWGLPTAWGILMLGAVIVAVAGIGAVGAVGAGIPAPGASGGSGASGIPVALVAGGGVMTCVGIAGAGVFGLWYIRLLSRYRIAFKQAVMHARQFTGQTPPAAG